VKTILVVEDERSIAEILAAVLEDEGYKVVIANNGKAGIECLDDVQPDLVLCDVMMPVIDGRDMVRAMGAHPSYQTIPVIMMSAASLPSGTHDYKYAAFVRKPFDIEVLLTTINNVLRTA
jgi:two-component system, OmpR family, alkaline phosphatase synthesis response regulator PhoP